MSKDLIETLDDLIEDQQKKMDEYERLYKTAAKDLSALVKARESVITDSQEEE